MRSSLIILIALLLIGCDKKPDARLTTPKGSAKTLMQAMYDNDLETAKACIVSGPIQINLVEAMTKMMVSMRGATDALNKRYPDEVKQIAGPSLDISRIDPKQIDEGTETIDGDVAKIALKGGKSTMHLVRADSVWKVDLAKSFTGDANMSDPTVARMVSGMFTAMAKAADQTKAEIEAGKYSSARESMQALTGHMMRTMEEEKQRAIKELTPR